MIKKCHICGHVGELTWRDGKYYCAMCSSEVAETDPVAQPQVQAQPQMQAQPSMTAANVICPICKNKENNQFDGFRYHCALCRTTFDLQQATQAQQYGQYNGAPNYLHAQKIEELKKQKKNNIVTGIVLIFLFWPASIYFFYKAYQTNQQLQTMGY